MECLFRGEIILRPPPVGGGLVCQGDTLIIVGDFKVTTDRNGSESSVELRSSTSTDESSSMLLNFATRRKLWMAWSQRPDLHH